MISAAPGASRSMSPSRTCATSGMPAARHQRSLGDQVGSLAVDGHADPRL